MTQQRASLASLWSLLYIAAYATHQTHSFLPPLKSLGHNVHVPLQTVLIISIDYTCLSQNLLLIKVNTIGASMNRSLVWRLRLLDSEETLIAKDVIAKCCIWRTDLPDQRLAQTNRHESISNRMLHNVKTRQGLWGGSLWGVVQPMGMQDSCPPASK